MMGDLTLVDFVADTIGSLDLGLMALIEELFYLQI